MIVEKLITDHIDTWSSALQTRSTAGRGSNGKIDLYGIKKLRELILELAVRGKLVPQDPNDEPASELLKRIAAEKAELVKQGKIKKQKPLPEISEDEKPFELPVGWEWVRLLDIATLIGDGLHGTPNYVDQGHYFFVNGNNLKNGCIQITNSTKMVSEDEFKKHKKELNERSVLLSINGTLGNIAYYNNEPVILGKSACYINLTSEMAKPYLKMLFESCYFKQFAMSNATGSTIKNLGLKSLSLMLVPLAPKEEQNRIVAHIEQNLILCDQLEQQSLTSLDAHQQLVEALLSTLTDSQNADELAESWARISQHFDTLFTTEASIDALKQTILQLAVMGKLVPQDPNDEPASELLKRIEQEKAQLVKEGKIKKQKPLPPVSDQEKPFELPQGWEWCRLPDLGELSRGKSKHRPRNDPALYVDGKYPLVQTGDVSRSNGTIKTFTALYNELGVKQSRLWPKGTLCITIAANIADSGILEFDACFPDSVVGYSPFISEIPVEYFDFFMRTIKSSLEKYAPSTAQKNINLDILSQVFVPCPPLNEFERVVRKVEALFSLLDLLKSRLQSAQQTQLHLADALTDAALN
ncbi:restriction endonuclease subunit S [Cronobacter dublinensis]|uniref:restriction endonuclease subunit S n=1 Tax=Cronobacter dublinensis TaxID=413497 RepID=UPI0013763BB7|nr:restriction endonuclease subunit S [Cronobacter dublinensis]EKY3088243.1 restriction endonuclease subunit S [Cronobacter dublinensis]ELQ6230067.1 restriction endonuclease subunit S [Cronobacter dublinensis]ELY5818239.1 restriction endonuclease subunit S [Cronobacter dublinensis]MDI7387280.1 restriction endonuclease subunit S [Cronobacter dublinensis]NCH04829.1 restriction endonuclease subunit S [Cronobacter dublinensis]